MIRRVEGLVIRGYRMSQSSKVVVLYTNEHGKLHLVAKGARRPKSKFGASLEPITWGSYVIYWRENRDLQTLSEGDILHPFWGMKQSYARTAYASAVCELLDHMTVDEDRNPLLCSVVLDSLRWMERVDEGLLELPLWHFQLKAAGALGYRPHLSGCVQCGVGIADPWIRFSPALGGIICSRCEGGGGMVLERTTVELLEQLQVVRPDRFEFARLERVKRAEVRGVLHAFWAHHLESRRKLRSLEFLDRMRAVEGASNVEGAASLAAEGAAQTYGGVAGEGVR